MSTMQQQQFDPSMFRFGPQQQQQIRSRRVGDIDFALPWSMDMDVMDGDTEYIILCELPGINKDKVDVRIENNMLTVKATKERCNDKLPESLKLRLNEIGFGTDERNVCLPLNVNQDEAQVSFKDGLLAIKFPKIIGHKANKKLEIQC
eukprot:gene29896-37025_t